ncbi:MAG: YggT family protein [Actinomycetes bacterium]|jgi:YggT family protein
MFSIGRILSSLIQVFLIALFARLILDYARMFARNWRPRGFVLAIAEVVFAITDPPLKFVRRFVPPLRLGAVNLDLSFIVVYFAVQMLARAVLLIP